MLRLLAGCLVLCLSLDQAVAEQQVTDPMVYSLARAPQLSASTLEAQWNPFLQRIYEDTGIRIELRTYPRREDFETDLFSGRPDFAFMNPYYAVLAKQKHGYIPLVRDTSRQLTGILVVRRDSPLQSVQELAGAAIAFPDANALGASLYPRAILTEKEQVTFKPVYLGNHENVYRSVFLGKFPAGGGVQATLAREPESLRSALRILYETPFVAPHPLIAHPRVPPQVRVTVVNAILAMAHDAAGRKLLDTVQLSAPGIVDYVTDYGALESLGLSNYAYRLGN